MLLNLINSKKAELEQWLEYQSLSQSILALSLVIKYHSGTRKDGNPEIIHLIETALFILNLAENRLSHTKLDILTASALLHDLVEDYPHLYSFDNLQSDFDDAVFQVVKRVTKPADFKKTDEYRSKYFKSISDNAFAIMVKGADRMHNLSTMVNGFSLEKRQSYILEVESYFYPMFEKAMTDFKEYCPIYKTIKLFMEKHIDLINYINRLENKNQ